jgi:hypothetical protein
MDSPPAIVRFYQSLARRGHRRGEYGRQDGERGTVNCKSFELLDAAGLERGLADAVRRSAAEVGAGTGGRWQGERHDLPSLALHPRWSQMPRLPIGVVVCLAMLALLAGLGGAAAPSYPEVATPTPLARFLLGPLPSRHSVCIAGAHCRHPRWRSLPPSP